MRFFAKEIIEAAKSDSCSDHTNAKEIAEHFGKSVEYVKAEIKFVRRNLTKILAD